MTISRELAGQVSPHLTLCKCYTVGSGKRVSLAASANYILLDAGAVEFSWKSLSVIHAVGLPNYSMVWERLLGQKVVQGVYVFVSMC